MLNGLHSSPQWWKWWEWAKFSYHVTIMWKTISWKVLIFPRYKTQPGTRYKNHLPIPVPNLWQKFFRWKTDLMNPETMLPFMLPIDDYLCMYPIQLLPSRFYNFSLCCLYKSVSKLKSCFQSNPFVSNSFEVFDYFFSLFWTIFVVRKCWVNIQTPLIYEKNRFYEFSESQRL